MNMKLNQELTELLNSQSSTKTIIGFLKRLPEGKLTKHENPQSHLCTYFGAYDPKAKEVFIGHHKKSGLWLFNGGHVDEGEEALRETVIREIGEEWGLDGTDFEIKSPEFFTITPIDNPTKQTCTMHYDVWHFIAVDKNSFKPDETKLSEEFHEAGWKTVAEARKLVSAENNEATLLAIKFLEDKYFV